MYSHLRNMLLATAGLALLAGCEQAPITGRPRLTPTNDTQLAQQADQLYREELSQNPLSRNQAYVAMVRRVGERIARAAENPPDDKWAAPHYRWEFNVIDRPDTINAYCLPGGKIAVYTGIFRVAPDEASLAAVIGHEVAHALLRHHGERAAQQAAIGAGGAMIGAVLGRSVSSSVLGSGIGIASSMLLMSFGRDQEYEADRVGMMLAALAGYDPAAAVGVWQRMSVEAGPQGQAPQYLSTHPTEGSRVREIEAHLPEAMQYYKPR